MTDFFENVKNHYTERVASINAIASKEVGARADENFNMFTWSYVLEGGIESPIEALFYVAFSAVNNTSSLCGYSDEPGSFLGEKDFLIAMPQHRVGKYRADFGCFYGIITGCLTTGYTYRGKWVAVELDGHDFHDKNEKQRRYEKHRDRFFQKQGYKVFRYTGSEINANPFNAAVEVVANLLDTEESFVWESLPDSFSGKKI